MPQCTLISLLDELLDQALFSTYVEVREHSLNFAAFTADGDEVWIASGSMIVKNSLSKISVGRAGGVNWVEVSLAKLRTVPQTADLSHHFILQSTNAISLWHGEGDRNERWSLCCNLSPHSHFRGFMDKPRSKRCPS